MRRFSRHGPLVVLIASLAVAFVLRYIVVMQYLDMGWDVANYLLTMQQVFGHDPTGMGLLRPPLIALPLKLFTLAFGSLTGVKVFGVLASVAIGVPFYLLARRICHPWIAVAVSVMVVFCPAYSDLLGWGYLTLVAIFFILLTLHFFLQVLEKPSTRNVILTGLCASLLVGFHQLSLVFFMVLMAVFLLALLVFNRKKLFESYKPIAAIVAIGGILSIPYVPTYIHLLQMMQSAEAGLSISVGGNLRTFSALLVSWSWFWSIALALALALAIAGMVFLWRQDRNRALLLAVMLLVPLALTIFVLPSPLISLSQRAYYFMYIPVWLLFGVVLSRLWSWQKLHLPGLFRQLPKIAAIALIAALLPWCIVSSQGQLRKNLDFYTYLDDTRWPTVEWIGQKTEPGVTIAVSPRILGWWIEGEDARTAFWVMNTNEVVYPFEQENSLVADRILSRNQGLENGNLRLAMTYPYGNAPGNPVLSVYVGGRYNDMLSFDDRQIYFMLDNGGKISLANAQNKEINITEDGESMQAVILYSMDGFNVTQTMLLNQGEQAATIHYHINCTSANITKFDIPVFFSYQPTSVSTDERSFEVAQEFINTFTGVPTAMRVNFDTKGASLEEMELLEQQAALSFVMENNEASITFNFSVMAPQLEGNVPVSHYIVPELLKDYGVDYVAIDLRPPCPFLKEMPEGTEEWLNHCPYYKLVYSKGDIRIYQVDTAALP